MNRTPTRHVPVTASNTQLISPCLGLLVTTTGNLVYQCGNSGADITLTGVAAGTVIPGESFLVKTTSTATVAAMYP